MVIEICIRNHSPILYMFMDMILIYENKRKTIMLVYCKANKRIRLIINIFSIILLFLVSIYVYLNSP
ncbi:hypothetical protein OIU77_010061 [Salix suchowensis]|uniref:Uncharacterized protein n=1 Tax=Salix suchowensis TaxID=1278906 RepID=A0ABQ9A8S1_9ROSI|nr:hypothetical protein OIU77_010061 [Salix suchowensis]